MCKSIFVLKCLLAVLGTTKKLLALKHIAFKPVHITILLIEWIVAIRTVILPFKILENAFFTVEFLAFFYRTLNGIINYIVTDQALVIVKIFFG